MELKAFHGDQKIKDFYIARVKAHREADEIVRGKYWELESDGIYRGCAVGCTIHGNDHSAYERELGIPQLLARLEDAIFENLPNLPRLDWPLRFLSAIKPGADLSKVWSHFAIWLLSDPEYGTIRHFGPAIKAATEKVVGLYKRRLVADEPILDEWRDAAVAAANRRLPLAAMETVEAAAEAEVEAAIWSAAQAAIWSAARVHSPSAAISILWDSAAKGRYYMIMADQLICLLEEAV